MARRPQHTTTPDQPDDREIAAMANVHDHDLDTVYQLRSELATAKTRRDRHRIRRQLADLGYHPND